MIFRENELITPAKISKRYKQFIFTKNNDLLTYFYLKRNKLHYVTSQSNVDEFYEEMGNTLKHKYKGCIIWLISSDIENIKFMNFMKIMDFMFLENF